MDITTQQTAPTTIEFKLIVSDANGVSVDTTTTENGTWSVSVPQNQEGSYNVRLEVIANGSPVPVPEEPVTEAVNSGSGGGAPGQGAQISNDKLVPEFPAEYEVDDEDAQGDNHRPTGDNSFDHINKDELDNIGSGEPADDVGTPIEDIASRVNGASGPQLPFDGPAEEPESDDDSEQSAEGDELEALLRASPDIPLDRDEFDPKKAAEHIISSIIPKRTSAIESVGTLLDANTRKRILKDPVMVAEMKVKAKRVQDLLNSIK